MKINNDTKIMLKDILFLCVTLLIMGFSMILIHYLLNGDNLSKDYENNQTLKAYNDGVIDASNYINNIHLQNLYNSYRYTNVATTDLAVYDLANNQTYNLECTFKEKSK